jgi:hypothetical protein
MTHPPIVAAAVPGRSAEMHASPASGRQQPQEHLLLLLLHVAGSSAGLALRRGC